MDSWDEEEAFTEKINPLMEEVARLCREYRIPMVAHFVIGQSESGPKTGTMSLLAPDMRREDGGQSVKVLRAAYPCGPLRFS